MIAYTGSSNTVEVDSRAVEIKKNRQNRYDQHYTRQNFYLFCLHAYFWGVNFFHKITYFLLNKFWLVFIQQTTSFASLYLKFKLTSPNIPPFCSSHCFAYKNTFIFTLSYIFVPFAQYMYSAVLTVYLEMAKETRLKFLFFVKCFD